MALDLTFATWNPAVGSLPSAVRSNVIYVLPAKLPLASSDDHSPLYAESLRDFPKTVRGSGLAVEFAHSRETRKFLSEYSGDPDVWSIALGLVGSVNEWIIFAVQQFLSHRARQTGHTAEDALTHELKVSIAELNPATGEAKGITVEGPGADVLKALEKLVRQGE
ncbi:hypothetical protein [Arthrobacter sp. AZCC_0090]|uniref:hypothetical protein n=1 Tax=Arthrobacter sp. AZCC_0090 TaxID=2735881 RepID=UPI00161D8C51|nr:hypothetical protein [Arthrobacter sp. AZCC_0090]MBB6406177.1 hypothetical protein [Arthrobacter sp. AZCC_0090]